MKTVRLRWFLLISIAIHTLFLWLSRLVPLSEPTTPVAPVAVRVQLISPTPPPQKKPPQPQEKPPPPEKKPPPRQKKPPPRKKPPPAQKKPPPPQKKTLQPDMSTPIPPTPTLDTPPPPPPVSKAPPFTEKIFPTAEESSTAGVPSTDIPDPSRFAHPIHGEPFVEVDYYTFQQRYNVDATDLCIDGDQLRTKERLTITETVTDYSKCRIRSRGDDDIEDCPPEADTEVVVFEGYLSSPLSFPIKVCLEYDDSNCRIVNRGDDDDEECREPKYEGNWAVGTQFQYIWLRRRLEDFRARLALDDLAAWPIERIPHRALLREAWRHRHNVSAYDAFYVAAARLHDAPLLIADGPLSKAPARGIVVQEIRLG